MPVERGSDRRWRSGNRCGAWWVVLGVLGIGSSAAADDWPGWMGPRRDNVWRESGILERFPANGPKILWRQPLAGGYAGPAVAQGRIVVTDYVTADNVKIANFERSASTGRERVWCLDEKTGAEIWKYEYPVTYRISYPAGPRCTPLVEDDRVYTLGAEGQLICFRLADGQIVWQKNLAEAYQAKTPLWGYAAHPLLDGPRLITLAGGEGSHVVALDKLTGAEIWRSLTSPEQGYAPPTIVQSEPNAVRQLVLLRPDAVSAVNPENGRELWSVPYEATNGSIIMSPLVSGDLLYAAGFSNKSLLLRLRPDGTQPEVVWRDEARQAFSPVNVQPHVVDGLAYGVDQGGEMVCLQLEPPQRLWSSTAAVDGKRPQGCETAFLVRQQDRWWLFNERGELIIARLQPSGYEEISRAKVIEPTNEAFGRKVVWSTPAFANRHAYIRNDQEIICVDLAQ